MGKKIKNGMFKIDDRLMELVQRGAQREYKYVDYIRIESSYRGEAFD